MLGRTAYRCYHTSAVAYGRRSLLAGKTVKFGQSASPSDQSFKQTTSSTEAESTVSSKTTRNQTLSVESTIIPPRRREPKPAPVDSEYTNYLSFIVDDPQYRDEQLRQVPLTPEERRKAILAKREYNTVISAHNAQVVPTGDSRRVRQWLAKNKRRRTRSDRSRNKQTFRSVFDESEDDHRSRLDLWENKAPDTQDVNDLLDVEEDMEANDSQDHRMRRERISRKEQAVRARTHLTSVKKRQTSKHEKEYV